MFHIGALAAQADEQAKQVDGKSYATDSHQGIVVEAHSAPSSQDRCLPSHYNM
jgi:hypothetical protein